MKPEVYTSAVLRGGGLAEITKLYAVHIVQSLISPSWEGSVLDLISDIVSIFLVDLLSSIIHANKYPVCIPGHCREHQVSPVVESNLLKSGRGPSAL